MSRESDLLLWVDVAVLKGEEIDAEYVGCYDATGFLAYDEHPAFKTERVKEAVLPAFFDAPIPSKPIEWHVDPLSVPCKDPASAIK